MLLMLCHILQLLRIIQFKILKQKNKSTLNIDSKKQEITSKKIKQALNKYKE